MLNVRTLAASAAMLAMLGSTAQAVSILPGGFVHYPDLPGTAVSGNSDFANPIVSGDLPFDRTEGGFVGGHVVDDLEHIRGRIAQTIYETPGSGELTFVHQLIFDELQVVGGSGGITNYSLSGFAGFDVDVDFNSDLSVAGFDVHRSADGDVLKFDLGGFFLIDFDGPVFVIRTNALAFDASGVFGANTVLGFGQEDIAANGTFAPSPVPVPPALALLLPALGALGLARRRKS